MPIPQDDINTNWALVVQNDTVGQIQAGLPADRNVRAFKYIAFATGDCNFSVGACLDIDQISGVSGPDIRKTPICMPQVVPKPVIGIEQDAMGIKASRAERDAQPGKRIVILSNGQPIGLLTDEK